MKKWLLTIGTVLLLFLAACGDSGSPSSGKSGNTTDNKVVRVGAVPDGFPHTYVENEEMHGFIVEVFEAIFDRLGYEIDWVLTDWNGVLANMESGKIDTVINFAHTEERGKMYDFTDPYYSSKAAIATSRDNPNIDSLSDLDGKELASAMGTNFENVLKEHYPDVGYEIIVFESVDVIYSDVASGKVDGFIYGREQLMAQIAQRDIPLQVVGEPFGDQPVALPFHKTEENKVLIEEVNESIKKIQEDGTFSEISQKWFGVDLLDDE